MPTDLARVDRATPAHVPDDSPVVITNDQVALIKATVAADATDAELALFFYDCRRRGVHPLDKLIHFTKRKGKYTPVTSIDFFRARAALTGTHMGTDDTVYTGQPGDIDFAATVTVYRMVQGERCAFTATARMAEYMPEAPNDFMWRKMPHGQIGKCAEALALRKGFPQQLDGLYTVEEMEQAAERPAARKTVQRASERVVDSKPVDAVLVTEGRVKDVRAFGKDKSNFALTLDGDATEFTTKDAAIALELEKFKGTDHQIRVTYEDRDYNGKTYHNIKAVAVVDVPAAAAPELPLTSDQMFR
jgi:phage recombination protein Bet